MGHGCVYLHCGIMSSCACTIRVRCRSGRVSRHQCGLRLPCLCTTLSDMYNIQRPGCSARSPFMCVHVCYMCAGKTGVNKSWTVPGQRGRNTARYGHRCIDTMCRQITINRPIFETSHQSGCQWYKSRLPAWGRIRHNVEEEQKQPICTAAQSTADIAQPYLCRWMLWQAAGEVSAAATVKHGRQHHPSIQSITQQHHPRAPWGAATHTKNQPWFWQPWLDDAAARLLPPPQHPRTFYAKGSSELRSREP